MLSKFSQILGYLFKSCTKMTLLPLFIFLMSFSSISALDDITYITPQYMLFETVLATQQDGRLEGDNYNVRLSILSYDGSTASNQTWSMF